MVIALSLHAATDIFASSLFNIRISPGDWLTASLSETVIQLPPIMSPISVYTRVIVFAASVMVSVISSTANCDVLFADKSCFALSFICISSAFVPPAKQPGSLPSAIADMNSSHRATAPSSTDKSICESEVVLNAMNLSSDRIRSLQP